MGEKNTTLNLRVNSNFKERARAAAKAGHRSLNALIEKLLEEYVLKFEASKKERK